MRRRKRTRDQLRAMFARMKAKTRTKIGRTPDLLEQDPIFSGYGVGAVTAFGLGTATVSPYLVWKLNKIAKHGRQLRAASGGMAHRIKKMYPELRDIQVTRSPRLFSSAYNPSRRKIQLGPEASRAITAHEFGHARTYTRYPKLGKVLMTSRKMTVPSLAAGILAQPAISATNMKDKNKRRARIAAAALPIAASSGVLADEAIASARAVRMLKKTGVRNPYRNSLELAPAFGTYLGGAVAASAWPITTARGYRKRDKRERIAKYRKR